MMNRKQTREVLVAALAKAQEMMQGFMDAYNQNDLTPEVRQEIDKVARQVAEDPQGAVTDGNLYGQSGR